MPESRPNHLNSLHARHDQLEPGLKKVMAYKPPTDGPYLGHHDGVGPVGKLEYGTVDHVPTLVWTPPDDPCLESAREAFQKVGAQWIKIDTKKLFASTSSVGPTSSTQPYSSQPTTHTPNIYVTSAVTASPRRINFSLSDKINGSNPINTSEKVENGFATTIVTPDQKLTTYLDSLTNSSAATTKQPPYCKSTLNYYMIGLCVLIGFLGFSIGFALIAVGLRSFDKCCKQYFKPTDNWFPMQTTYMKFQDPSRMSVMTDNSLLTHPSSTLHLDTSFNEPTSVFISVAGRFYCLTGKQVAIVEDPAILYDIMESFSASQHIPSIVHYKLKQAIREHEQLLTDDSVIANENPLGLPKWDGIIQITENVQLRDCGKDISDLHDQYAKLKNISSPPPLRNAAWKVVSEIKPKKTSINETISALNQLSLKSIESVPISNAWPENGVDKHQLPSWALKPIQAHQLFVFGLSDLKVEFNGIGTYKFDPDKHGYEPDGVPEGRHILIEVTTPIGIEPNQSQMLPAKQRYIALFVPSYEALDPTLQIL